MSELVVMDARLADHDWSAEILGFAEREEELLEQGELHAAAAWNAGFRLEDLSLGDRVTAMQARAFELQAESEARTSAGRDGGARTGLSGPLNRL